jgi:hypothetical protein
MTADANYDGLRATDGAGRICADDIADALGELAGKRLDRPTAHSLGKLFQKRLVGRPAWIGEGQTVATLQKSTGHNENSYRVDLATPGQAPEPQPFKGGFAADTGKNIPHISHIPPNGGPKDDKAGNLGKEGNVFGGDGGSSVWRARL